MVGNGTRGTVPVVTMEGKRQNVTRGGKMSASLTSLVPVVTKIGNGTRGQNVSFADIFSPCGDK